MAVEQLAAAPAKGGRARSRLSAITARLTAATVLSSATGLVTGPLLARALGPSGRGDLQAIIVPLSLVPVVLSLGIPAYAYRTLPRGRTVREVLPSLAVPLLLLGLLAVAGAVPVADALAGGRQTVRTFLIIGFFCAPPGLVLMLLASSLAALERWHGVVAMTVIPFLVPFVATVVLYLSGHLTVATAATATIVGSLAAVVPAIPLLLRARRPRFRLSLAREGVSFGAKSWLGGLAQTANSRLDQVLMITMVPPRQLGLYAVATTLATAALLVSGSLSPPLMTRIAAGHRHLMPQAVRIIVAGTIGLNVALALVTPVLLSVLFGPRFHGATPMALVLLAATVPLAGASVLSTALQADGAPLIPTVAEGIALTITVAGLLILLPTLQAMGAALVSVAAYGASFLFQLVMASRRLGVPISQFIVPSRADVEWARGLFADMLRSRGRAK